MTNMTNYDPNYKPAKEYMLVGQKDVIFNEKNQLLLLQRSPLTTRGGSWSLHGGGLDK